MGDPQSLNLYAYVRNKPITNVDLDGHCWGGGWCDQYGTPYPTDSEIEREEAMKRAQQTSVNPTYRLVATSDTIGNVDGLNTRQIDWSVYQLSSNGYVYTTNELLAPDPGFYVTESQTNGAMCGRCVQFGPHDFRSGGGVDDNQKVIPAEKENRGHFFDNLRPGAGSHETRSEQTFWVSKSPGLNNADRQQILVRIRGKDYGSLGIWTDGIHTQWVQGYRPGTMPGGNP
jgi:hypothetical protein